MTSERTKGEALVISDGVDLQGGVGEEVRQGDVAVALVIQPRGTAVLHCLRENAAARMEGGLDNPTHIQGG